jgi:hypothetical protein
MDGSGAFETNSRDSKYKDKFHKVGSDFTWLLYDWNFEYGYEGKNRKVRSPRFLESVFSNVILGHNRAGTRGQVNTGNAHPFDTGRYVGFHNGTLNERRYDSKESTDSQKMFEDIEDRGVVPVLSSLGDTPSNAFAVAIWDKEDKVLILGKNSQRPLAFAIHKKRATLYYASEYAMLGFILTRHRMKEGEDYEIFHFANNTIASVDPVDVRPGKQDIFNILWRKEEEVPKGKDNSHFSRRQKKQQQQQKRGVPLPEIDLAAKSEGTKENEELPFDPPAFLRSNTNKEESGSNVVPFNGGVLRQTEGMTMVQIFEIDEKKDDPKLSKRYLKCNCGKHRLNLIASMCVRNRMYGYPTYLPISETFKCDLVDPAKSNTKSETNTQLGMN